jgi:hypothetical protein
MARYRRTGQSYILFRECQDLVRGGRVHQACPSGRRHHPVGIRPHHSNLVSSSSPRTQAVERERETPSSPSLQVLCQQQQVSNPASPSYVQANSLLLFLILSPTSGLCSAHLDRHRALDSRPTSASATGTGTRQTKPSQAQPPIRSLDSDESQPRQSIVRRYIPHIPFHLRDAADPRPVYAHRPATIDHRPG